MPPATHFSYGFAYYRPLSHLTQKLDYSPSLSEGLL